MPSSLPPRPNRLFGTVREVHNDPRIVPITWFKSIAAPAVMPRPFGKENVAPAPLEKACDV